MLRTVLDARAYMLRLSKDPERSARWQRAAQLLLAKADVGAVSGQLELALLYDGKLDVTARAIGLQIQVLNAPAPPARSIRAGASFFWRFRKMRDFCGPATLLLCDRNRVRKSKNRCFVCERRR